MAALHGMLSRDGANPLVDNLFYFSVDGMQIGIAKSLLGAYGEQPIPFVPTGCRWNGVPVGSRPPRSDS